MASWTWHSVLSGVIPPLISPLDDSGDVDTAATARVVDHVLEGGCTGLFVLGGCGEGAWLTTTQRGAIIGAAVRAANGRAPVLAGCMLPATGPTLDAARQAADVGADALVIGSPYYFTIDAAAQREHVEQVLAAVDLPILLYNIPQCTHNVLAPSTVAALAGEQRVLGIKDSAGDLRAFQQFLTIRRDHPDFHVLQGDEGLMAASLLAGADGLVPGLANVVPHLFAALLRAAKAGDVDAVRPLQEEILEIGTLHTHGHWLPALKAACAIAGLGNGRPSLPLLPATDEQRTAIAAILGAAKTPVLVHA
jgi:4-hydroxy-tetrahydrodipicolinate synthase